MLFTVNKKYIHLQSVSYFGATKSLKVPFCNADECQVSDSTRTWQIVCLINSCLVVWPVDWITRKHDWIHTQNTKKQLALDIKDVTQEITFLKSMFTSASQLLMSFSFDQQRIQLAHDVVKHRCFTHFNLNAFTQDLRPPSDSEQAFYPRLHPVKPLVQSRSSAQDQHTTQRRMPIISRWMLEVKRII